MRLIRQETPNDYDAVYDVVKRAFACAAQSDGTEQDLVVALHGSDAFIPELSLVAEENGKIVGYILFTLIHIGPHTALALAPLAVAPEYQRQGIGRALIQEGHRIAQNLGYSVSVVLGSDQYYPQLGYVPASLFGIRAPFQVPDAHFMAIHLSDHHTDISGTVEYAKEFGIE